MAEDYHKKALEILKAASNKDHPITGKRLAGMIGLPYRISGKEGADMRKIIHDLRVSGYPICASDKGYWYAKEKRELENFIFALTKRIQAQKEVLEGLKQAFDKIEEKTEEQKMMEFSRQFL